MIHIITPYRIDKNLGRAYNEAMEIVPTMDSACFIDGDTLFLTYDFGTIIEEYSKLYPDAVLTCYTNRIHRLSKQLYNGVLDDSYNIKDWIMEAETVRDKRTVTPILPGEGMSGFLMVVPKTVWHKVQFIENGGCLGVDSKFRIDVHNAGIPILIMDGLLIWHTYRLINNTKNHLL
jgi:hypothetical protein